MKHNEQKEHTEVNELEVRHTERKHVNPYMANHRKQHMRLGE